MRTISNVTFEWDPTKSVANERKHGLSLASAAALWEGPVLTLPSKQPGELRHLAIGLIADRHWTIIYTLRGNRVRLISARRSRSNEKALFHEFVR